MVVPITRGTTLRSWVRVLHARNIRDGSVTHRNKAVAVGTVSY